MTVVKGLGTVWVQGSFDGTISLLAVVFAGQDWNEKNNISIEINFLNDFTGFVNKMHTLNVNDAK